MEQDELDLLERLSRLCGIVDGYYDVWRNFHVTSPETRRLLLGAMGVRTGTRQELREELAVREAAADGLPCAPVLLAPEGGPQSFPVSAAADEAVEAALGIEGGELPLTLSPSPEGGGPILAGLSHPLPRGLHRVELRLRGPDGSGRTRRSLLAVSPSRGFEPPRLADGGRVWGINLPLYGLRSARNWGFGDLADLRAAATWAAELGADFVGLLPLHALFNESPYGQSPYYPSSRLFLNPVYVAVDELPEADGRAVRELLESARVRAEIAALRDADLVDYPAVWASKREALELCWAEFQARAEAGGRDGRAVAFEAWQRAQGRPLEDFATFGALRDHLARRDGLPSPWQRWDRGLRVPDGAAVRAFRESHPEAVGFQAWLQWLAEGQLRQAAEAARGAGMTVGLYLDLALGADPSGADGWVFQNLLALGASAGCPPDPFSLLGQRWGLPPVIPERHREAGYELFLEMLRRNAARAGALRIDHALSLWRLFWVPEGLPASRGAYVAERAEELLALLRIVSREAGCLVVGEDLGTIPAEVREGLMASGFYSYRLGIFEKEPDGRYKRPGAYPRQALVSASTHDLPPLDGFLLGRDLEVKRELGRYPDEASARGDAEGRRWDCLRLLEALAAEGLLPSWVTPALDVREDALDALAEACHAYLARTPSALFLANLDDLLGGREMQNLPGTLDEHPNWRRKVPVPLERWAAHGRAGRVAAAIRRERRSLGA